MGMTVYAAVATPDAWHGIFIGRPTVLTGAGKPPLWTDVVEWRYRHAIPRNIITVLISRLPERLEAY